MPRYFFDTTDAGKITRDETGIELPDDEAACRRACTVLLDVSGRTLSDGETHAFACDARNEADLVVYRRTLTYRGDKV